MATTETTQNVEETTSSSPFLDLPNEIHIEIFKSCTGFADAASFAATCRQLQSIWKSHQKAVISYIGSNCIVAFDDALRAVRAIDIAERQYQFMALQSSEANVTQDDEPPPRRIPIRRLGARSSPPSPNEISKLLDLKHFVETALFIGHEQKDIHIFCQQSSSKIQLPRACPHGVDPAQTPAFAEEVDFKIYASMYRFFLVSAALSSVYWEPFFTDHPKADSLRAIFSFCPTVRSSLYVRRQFGGGELSYVRQWPCYNKRYAKQSQLDEIFGEIGEYLLERGRREGIWGQEDEGSNSNTQQQQQQQGNNRDFQTAGAIQAIMMIISCHELFWCAAQQELSCAGRAVERTPTWSSEIRYRAASVTFLGIHGALNAWVPYYASDISRRPYIHLLSRSVGHAPDGGPLSQLRLLKLFHELLHYDRQDASLDLDSDLPYELGFFEYLLRRHFGLRVQFMWGYGQSSYAIYMANGIAFRGVEQFRKDVPDILSRYTS
ncbi:hypothetical protein TWF730_004373 [Orbilia blumenaviensis]|uniref:F-box domain-containing protein n=1 Tax=Orbilia blumenaviensis TaxID=1796055 RepID=A0AAV9U1G8_9PEZI